MLLGIDVSNNQGAIDWASVSINTPSFCYVKATEGLTYQDPFYTLNVDGAKLAGIPCGSYHMFHPSDSATAQADYFLAQAQAANILAGDLLPALDLEFVKEWSGISPDDSRSLILEWLTYVEGQTLVKPIVYMGPNFFNEVLAGQAGPLDQYKLWLANYSNTASNLNGWTNWTFWQFSQTGKFPGIQNCVDLNYFNGDALDVVLLP